MTSDLKLAALCEMLQDKQAKLVKALAKAKDRIEQQAGKIAALDKLVYAVCNGTDVSAGVAYYRAAAIKALRARDDRSWLYLGNIADALAELSTETT